MAQNKRVEDKGKPPFNPRRQAENSEQAAVGAFSAATRKVASQIVIEQAAAEAGQPVKFIDTPESRAAQQLTQIGRAIKPLDDTLVVERVPRKDLKDLI